MSGINGFTFNRLLDSAAKTISRIEGFVDEAETMINWDDDSVYGDDLDAKHARDDVRHIASQPNALRLDYLRNRLDSLAFRVSQMRKNNHWVREDMEEPESRVGMVVAEEGTEAARAEVKDGLRDRD